MEIECDKVKRFVAYFDHRNRLSGRSSTEDSAWKAGSRNQYPQKAEVVRLFRVGFF